MQDKTVQQVEKIPVRQPDGSFVMVEVGGSDKKTDAVQQSAPKPIVKSTTPVEKPKTQPIVSEPKPNPKPIMAKSNNGNINWDESVDKVFQSVHLELFDESAITRLKAVIMSRLRDVRDVVATKEALKKDRSKGGLGLNEEDANRVIDAINAEHTMIHLHNNAKSSSATPGIQIGGGVVEDPFDPKAEINALVESDLPMQESDEYMNTIARFINKDNNFADANKSVETQSTFAKATADKDFASKLSMPKVQPQEIKVRKTEPPKPIFKPEPPISLKSNNINDSKQDVDEIKSPPNLGGDLGVVLKVNQPKTKGNIKQNILKPTEFTKPKPSMNDVVAEKRLMGPIDELRSMRLVDFRRLGNSTAERLQKIRNHIDELEEESFAKKVEAIQAWRSSPIYRMYVQIGSQSLMGIQTVSDVIKEKQEQGEEVLTQEEFEQLTDFNKKLKY